MARRNSALRLWFSPNLRQWYQHGKGTIWVPWGDWWVGLFLPWLWETISRETGSLVRLETNPWHVGKKYPGFFSKAWRIGGLITAWYTKAEDGFFGFFFWDGVSKETKTKRAVIEPCQPLLKTQCSGLPLHMKWNLNSFLCFPVSMRHSISWAFLPSASFHSATPARNLPLTHRASNTLAFFLLLE